MLKAARRLLDLALEAGADEAEVFGLVGRSVDVDLRRDAVEMAGESVHQGLGLRAVVKGAVGFSSTSDLPRLEEVARGAIKAAKARGPDDQWKALPYPAKTKTPEDVFDPQVDETDPEGCIDMALELLEGCSEVKGVEPVSGGVTCASGAQFIVNSHGVSLWERGTSLQAALETIAKGDGVGTGYEFGNARTMGLDIPEIGRQAALLARGSLGGGRVETGAYQVLLRPVAVAELFEYTLMPALNADNVQKGRSPLAGRIGTSVAPDHLQVTDDGLLKGGMGTAGFDDEGVPTRRNVLIGDGCLRGFLYDSYTAGKEGRESTGNAVRGGYSEVPGIGTHNLILGSKETVDLLPETRRGVLVGGLIGAHTANPISGDFSVEARNSFVIEDGAPARPIKSAMIAGNVFDLLKDMEVGCDQRAVGSVVVPTVRVSLRVIGG